MNAIVGCCEIVLCTLSDRRVILTTYRGKLFVSKYFCRSTSVLKLENKVRVCYRELRSIVIFAVRIKC